MKRILLLLLLHFFILQNFAQQYRPMLDQLNEWHFTTCYFGCQTDVYYTDGDTLVNGKNYKILDGYHYISRTFLLREDVPEKKVFLYVAAPGFNQEYLLYDFSLEEGAVFNMNNPISPFPQDGGPFVLDSIVARPLVDGNNYKHYYFSPAPGNTVSTENAVWIEGVGSLSIVNAPGGHPDVNQVGQLSCAFKNTEAFYSNLDSIVDCIPLILNIGKHALDSTLLIQKPGSEICELTNAEAVKTVLVYDVSGKKVSEITNPGQHSIQINLNSLQRGLFLLVAKDFKGGTRTFKLLK